MAYLRHQDAHAHFRDKVVEGIKQIFPIEGRHQSLHVEDVEVAAADSPDNIRAQYEAKMAGQTWAAPIHATIALKDKQGNVINRTRLKVAELPQITKRYSYIVNGQEYQVDNQWQLKPGVYTQRRQNGELESRFNVIGRAAFDMVFHPDTKQFILDYNDSKIPLYPIMKAMGHSDAELEKMWGKEILEANRSARKATSALEQFAKTTQFPGAPPPPDLEAHVRKVMQESQLNHRSTEITLGKGFNHITGDTLGLATKKLLKVQSGHPEDDRDSLVFKELRSVGDFAADFLKGAKKDIKAKVDRRIDKATTVRHALPAELLNKPLREVFTNNTAARTATQINPAEMLSASLQTTILGPGGIKSERSVTDDAKLINPSHFGFIDPINTPEGGKTGIVLRLASGVQKVGTEPRMPMYDLKTGKVEQVDPYSVLKNKVVLADQVKWVNGKPVPLTKSVRMLGEDNEPTAGALHEARYVMRRPTHMLNITTNLIPFANNTNGARAGYGSRHLEQAISLVHRDAPLVQASTGVEGDMGTFDRLVGSSASHRSMVDGKVTKVTPNGIHVQDAKGATHEVQLYNHFPLNDLKSMMHSEPLVKVGDAVKAGQVVADTNYTRNGALALGTNLRVGFLPYHGYNFEDGLVISESAAKQLSSQHMYKHELEAREDTVFSPHKFKVQHPTVFSREQFEHIQEDGTVKVGTKVKPGDPLVIAMHPYQIKDRTGLGAIRKGLAGAFTDASLKWEGEHEGEVVSVYKAPDGKVRVHVRTVEPMRPGDKMCFDAETEVLTASGWKSVTQVTLEDAVCCLSGGSIVYERPTAVHSYAHGGRMYRIASQQVDLFVTEEHQLYVEPRNQSFFGLHSPKDVFGKRVSYKKDGVWSAPKMPDVHLPSLQVCAGQGGRGVKCLPEKVLPARTYMMLLGMFLSEGNLVDEPNGNYGIEIAQSKPEGVRELEAALSGAGLKFCQHGDKYRLYSKQLLEHFRQFGYAKDKFIPAHLFQWAKEDLAVLFYWLVWGDGHRKDGRVVNYTTTSRQLADDMQRLCLHIGYAANIDVQEAHAFIQNGREYWASTRYVVRVITKKLTPTVNHSHVRKQGAQIEEWVEGYTGAVYCVTVPSHVLYVRRNGKPCWSGNSNRHGGKGIVTTILPDHEMPHTKDGKPIDVAFNPAGIPGRMNVGQVLEVTTGKIAQKTGKPYIVQNFASGTADVLEKVKGELKDHKLSDTEELFDPHTGKSLGNVLVGPQHMFKLVHQIDKKLAVRPGMTLPGVTSEAAYTPATLQPAGGGHAGGQAVGALGVYCLLAHGARANLREMQSFKSEGPDPQTNEAKAWPSQHNAVWAAIQQGTPLPTPRPTFAFKRFENMLKGAGVNIEKKGHEFILGPLTDKHILSMSNGELKDPTKAVTAKLKDGEPMPMPGGIFDERITGGHGGNKWSHISLAEPIPNPIFEGPIKHLTGLTKGQYEDIVFGKASVLPDGRIGEVGKGKTGGAGIKLLLDKIHVPDALKKAEARLKTVPASKVDKVLKQVKYLRALNDMGVKSPAEAYVLHHLPVLPPANRPLAVLPSGDIRYEDINGLYKEFGQINQQLKDPVLQKGLTDKRKEGLRKDLYDGVRAIMGAHIPYKDAKNKGLLHVIQGSTPKEGYFQDVLTSRRQDLSMRSTIVPEPALGLDEVGLPKHAALKLFAPFVVRNLVQSGGAAHALEAQKKLASTINGKNDPLVWKALETTMQERPVLLKRDPALHQYSVQAFKAKPVTGSAIRIHPLVTGGFGADFDGDAMSAYVPITHEAVKEAHKMYPSQNLFSEATGQLMYVPGKENVSGLFRLSQVGKTTSHKFGSSVEAIHALKKGTVGLNDVVHIDGKPSTAGRAVLASALPTDMQHKVLYDLGTELTQKDTAKLLTEVAQKHKADFGVIVNRFKDLGNGAISGKMNLGDAYVFTGAQTLGLRDFEADKVSRDSALATAAKKIVAVRDMKIPEREKEEKAIAIWEEAGKQMQAAHVERMKKNPNNLFDMFAAGVKPVWDQYKQMALAPMLMQDSSGRVIPAPVTRSYGEGLDMSGYWTHLHGTRRGTVRKVQEVQDPGYMTKLLQNTASHIHVDQHDCGTSRGVAMAVSDKEVHDRYLQQDFKTSSLHIPAGTLLTPELVGKMRAADKNAQIVVRSPLRCESEKGVCAHCAGLSSTGDHHPIGDALGVQAVHALGERAVQLTLKEFHCLHEHTTVLVRRNGCTYHTTLGALFAEQEGTPTQTDDGEAFTPDALQVWTRAGWTRVRQILRHPQQSGTSMVLLRTRSGHFIISQDNHPHMLRDNQAVCPTCKTYPKKSNGGKQYYCRKCKRTWVGVPHDTAPVCAVEPAHVTDKSHRGFILEEPSADLAIPTLSNGWLAGMYCAEGWVQVVDQTNTVGVGFGQSAGWLLERLGDELRKEYPTQHQSRCGGGIVLYNGGLGEHYSKSFGRYSRNKGLTAGWTGYDKAWLYDFVAGLLDGDGTISKNVGSQWSTATIYTTSALLAHQIHWILKTLSVVARTVVTTHRELTAHQGLAVKFSVTTAVAKALHRSEKLLDVVTRPAMHAERFADVVDYVRPYFFAVPPMVYDLSTDDNTLSANGLWTHNSGGVTGSTGMSSSLDRMHQLTDLPEKIPDAASLAMVSGKVEKIEKDATGTKVWIGGQAHHVGKDRLGHSLVTHFPGASSTTHGGQLWHPPTVGMHVEAGQHLSDPTRTVVNPRDLYNATKSVERLQNHLTDEIYKLYKDEGTKRKHVETVVRAMTSITRVKNPGDSSLLRGEAYALSHVNKLNKELKNKIVHEPVIRGVEMLPHELHTDWMAKLQHERLRGTIMDAAATLGVSNIHGNHPISALAYGAEFGLTKAHANQPGMGHLATVPEHHY